MGLFGKSPSRDPKEQVTEWCRKIRKESSQLDRQIVAIKREEEKVKRSIKEAAKKGDKDVCKIYAKELVRSKKAINKIYTSKAHLNSIQLHMKEQLALLKTVGSLQKSTQVMNAVQALYKVPEVAGIMRELSKEMMKAGILEEMVEDTFEGFEDQEELEAEAEDEINNILWEVTAGQIGKAPAAATHDLPSVSSAKAKVTPDPVSDDEEELEQMQNRLQALRS
jgi:charged multivesicular body protein 3